MANNRATFLTAAAALVIAVTHILIAPGRQPGLAERVTALEDAVFGRPRLEANEIPTRGLGRLVREAEVTAKVQGKTIDVLWEERKGKK